MPDGPEYNFTSVGDTAEIVSDTEAQDLTQEGVRLKVEVLSGRFRFAHRRSDARRGDILRDNQSAELDPHGEPIHCYVDNLGNNGEARLLVRRAQFELIPDPVSRMFSAGVSEPDGSDVPVATEESDEHHTEVDFGADTSTNSDGYEEYRFTLSPPSRASEVTIHADTLPAFPTGSTVWSYIRFGHGTGQNSDDPVTVTGSTPSGTYDNPDYRMSIDGTDDYIFVTADVPSFETLQIVFLSDASDPTSAEMSLNAMVR